MTSACCPSESAGTPNVARSAADWTKVRESDPTNRYVVPPGAEPGKLTDTRSIWIQQANAKYTASEEQNGRYGQDHDEAPAPVKITTKTVGEKVVVVLP